jgi:hypothetical protein
MLSMVEYGPLRIRFDIYSKIKVNPTYLYEKNSLWNHVVYPEKLK